ncbi:hypothetical protein [Wolbachia pipientis]|nr:hypothetical protein [Wolbachia pipientis]
MLEAKCSVSVLENKVIQLLRLKRKWAKSLGKSKNCKRLKLGGSYG